MRTRPGRTVQAESGVPVIGVARTFFRGAVHAAQRRAALPLRQLAESGHESITFGEADGVIGHLAAIHVESLAGRDEPQ